jgi:hypothetical protein
VEGLDAGELSDAARLAPCGEAARGILAGEYHLGYTSPREHQSNFESRVTAYEVLLRSQINLLRIQLPEEEIRGVYKPGEEYDFYRDLSSLTLSRPTR